jgi:hypothetical protein
VFQGQNFRQYLLVECFTLPKKASWWNAKLPPNKVDEISKKTRDYFQHNKVTKITHDIILAYGRKP